MGQGQKRMGRESKPIDVAKADTILPITHYGGEEGWYNAHAAGFVCMEGTKFPAIQSPAEI